MESFKTFLKRTIAAKVVDASVSYDDYMPLDLSIGNTALSEVNLSDALEFEQYVDNYLLRNRARVAYGGYNEERNLYKRSSIFNQNAVDERNIHIGLDLWIAAGTAVIAALEGKIHSFAFNSGLGNYGPTIILEHHIENNCFYTLYGHLTLESITGIAIADTVMKGSILGFLGDASVNGDYSPHLHFQIIKEIGDYFGDYPGVCSKKDLDFYMENCPNPELLLKIKQS
jgi:murein DD-endopeptidase MepM/ murein hydrolase activator NlpD